MERWKEFESQNSSFYSKSSQSFDSSTLSQFTDESIIKSQSFDDFSLSFTKDDSISTLDPSISLTPPRRVDKRTKKNGLSRVDYRNRANGRTHLSRFDKRDMINGGKGRKGGHDQRRARWCFTCRFDLYSESFDLSYTPSQEEITLDADRLFGLLIDECSIFIFQLEQGNLNGATERHPGYLHWQGYFELHNKKSHTWIRDNIYPFEYLTISKGLPTQAWHYCEKLETRVSGPWWFGKPTDKEGAQKQIEAYVDACKRGETDAYLIIHHGSCFARYPACRNNVRYAFKPVRETPLKVLLFYGPPGTGKTKHAYALAKSLGLEPYELPIGKDFWLTPHFHGKKFIIIDEFKVNIGLTDLLKLLDQGIIEAPMKGSHGWWGPEWVVLTTNKNPWRWYKYNNRDWEREALFRRIHETFLFEKNEEGVPRPVRIDIDKEESFTGIEPEDVRHGELMADHLSDLNSRYKLSKMTSYLRAQGQIVNDPPVAPPPKPIVAAPLRALPQRVVQDDLVRSVQDLSFAQANFSKVDVRTYDGVSKTLVPPPLKQTVLGLGPKTVPLGTYIPDVSQDPFAKLGKQKKKHFSQQYGDTHSTDDEVSSNDEASVNSYVEPEPWDLPYDDGSNPVFDPYFGQEEASDAIAVEPFTPPSTPSLKVPHKKKHKKKSHVSKKSKGSTLSDSRPSKKHKRDVLSQDPAGYDSWDDSLSDDDTLMFRRPIPR